MDPTRRIRDVGGDKEAASRCRGSVEPVFALPCIDFSRADARSGRGGGNGQRYRHESD